MGVLRGWCIIFTVAAACTGGVRTECNETAQISLLTSVHNDPLCMKPSTKGIMLYEAAKLLAEIHNNRTDGFHIGIIVLDTCGSVTGTLKAFMKALVLADTNCLHPPHYLGVIGSDTMNNAEAVRKVTSILKVPHIVKKSSVSPYLHLLLEDSNSHIIQGVLRITEILKWKSFTLVTNGEDENGSDVQNIAKKLTIGAAANGLCVIVHDNDEEDYTLNIVHIGKPEVKFFSELANATILVVSEGDLKDYLNSINSTNTILLLEDSSNIVMDLDRRVENSHWWAADNSLAKYDAKELKQVRWLNNAIEIYVKALNELCKNKKCKKQVNPMDWNHIVSNVLIAHNAEAQIAPRFLDLSMKMKMGNLMRLGGVMIRKNRVRVYWGESKPNEENDEENIEYNDDNIPHVFRGLLNRDKEEGCAVIIKEIRITHEKDNDTAEVLVSGMDNTEWWTMVGTVSGVGIAMFVIGILAVYVIYANIRGPRYPKNKDHPDRDTSLKRMGSDRDLPATITTRNQRTKRTPQRADSDRSNVSERSV